MKKTYYLLITQGGVEPSVRGPYQSEKERDNAAKQIRGKQEEDDGMFWADIDRLAGLSVGSYPASFFWQD